VPHVFPCRLVDAVDAGTDGPRAVVLVTGDSFLTGTGTWPITLLAEAMAQSILLVDPPEDVSGLRLVGLDDVRMLQPVVPGDRLEVEVKMEVALGRLRRYRCAARRDGALAATAGVTVSS
jgi:3-hydroxymyristoyl/3-hydroxydecanoyl-(acyl carrier protein) dehydratase